MNRRDWNHLAPTGIDASMSCVAHHRSNRCRHGKQHVLATAAMPAPHVVTLILLAAIGMSGCNPRDDSTGSDSDTAAAGKAVPSASTTSDADVSMRYSCQAHTKVAITNDGRARVSLPDGRVVDLDKVVGSTPADFTGSSLYLTIGAHDASLSQDDGNNELACKPD